MLSRVLAFIRTRIKYIQMNCRSIISAVLKSLGVSFAVFEFATELIPKIMKGITINESLINIWTFFLLPVGITLAIELWKIDLTYKIDRNGEQRIIVSIGNYIDNLERNIDAVNVFTIDDSFNMDPKYMADGSIHKQFTERYFKDNYQVLQDMVLKSLEMQGIAAERQEEFAGKVFSHYPIGSIASIQFRLGDTEHETLLFVNSYRKHSGNAFGMYPDQNDYIPKLWEYIDKQGITSDKVMVHLFGTKYAMVNKSRNAVAEEIIDTFFKSDAFTNRSIKTLVISISPEYYTDGGIDMRILDKYITCKCFLAAHNE